jgi:MFS family permease
MLTDSPGAWVLGGVLIGISSGSEYGLIPYALLRYFGGRAYGELYGFIYGTVWLSMGIFPLASAAAFDLIGSYTIAWISGGACMAVAAALLLLLPHFPEKAAG